MRKQRCHLLVRRLPVRPRANAKARCRSAECHAGEISPRVLVPASQHVPVFHPCRSCCGYLSMALFCWWRGKRGPFEKIVPWHQRPCYFCSAPSTLHSCMVAPGKCLLHPPSSVHNVKHVPSCGLYFPILIRLLAHFARMHKHKHFVKSPEFSYRNFLLRNYYAYFAVRCVSLVL